MYYVFCHQVMNFPFVTRVLYDHDENDTYIILLN